MCDIKEKTQLKTMTVYKAVFKDPDGKYRTPFANALLGLGRVPKYTSDDISFCFHNPNHPIHGKVSGFLNKKHAIILARETYMMRQNWERQVKVLKIKLGGTILKGTTWGICENLQKANGITYAGSEIISMKEVDY